MSKYKEIFKLKKMLEDANIEFEFYDESIKDEEIENMELPGETVFDIMMCNKLLANREYYHIVIRKNNENNKSNLEEFEDYINYEKRTRLISIIQGYASYGENEDLLEIMGLTQNNEEVEGYLTAEEVFNRIKKNI